MIQHLRRPAIQAFDWTLTIAITMLGLVAFTFFIGRVLPIDPVIAIIGAKAPPDIYDKVYHELGLDRPVWEQFGRYLWNILNGDLGTSFVTTRPILTDIGVFFPATLELATFGILIGVVLGVPLGIMAAVWRETWIDYLVRIVSLVGFSIPIFWLGLVGLFLFYARLEWIGGPGQIDTGYDDIVEPVTGMLLLDSAMAGEWEVFGNAFSHAVLPGCLLGFYSLAYIGRMTRSAMLEQLSQGYMLTARIKGLSEARAIMRHALPNAAIPLVTIIALSYGSLLEGSVLLETVFAWPGLGNYIASSLLAADMNAVLGGTLVVGAIFIGFNLLSDALYRFLDPRSK